MQQKTPTPQDDAQEASYVHSLESLPDASLERDIIIAGDCVSVLKSFPPKSIDLVFADPPYNLQLQRELYRPNMTRVMGVTDEWDSFRDLQEYDAFTTQWLKACQDVMKDMATLWVIGTYHNIHRIGKIMMDLGFWILNEIVWIKTNPTPNFRGVRFTNAHETLLWAKKSAKQERYTFHYHVMKQLNGGKQMRSDWRLPICSGRERLQENGSRLHSTQKPEALLERIILASSNPGDIILDPFFGTGTTGAVAKRLGRHYIGIEQDVRYVEAARKRMEAVEPDMMADILQSIQSKRSLPKVKFATLVAEGYILPGTTLYLDRKRDRRGVVLEDGTVRLADGYVASIHRAGARAGGWPACNGWEHWFYEDIHGQLAPIDRLRECYRTGGELDIIAPKEGRSLVDTLPGKLLTEV